jgi:hypothetical protein
MYVYITCPPSRQINLLILSTFHRENVEIWILCVRMSSIAFAFQQILLLVLRTPIKTNEEIYFYRCVELRFVCYLVALFFSTTASDRHSFSCFYTFLILSL